MNKFSIFTTMMRVVTYLSLLALLFTYISPYVSPEKGVIFSIFGIIAPIIIALNIILAVYWILLMDKIAIVTIVGLLCGIGFTARLIKVPIIKDIRPEGTILKVLTYNAHAFTTKEYKKKVDESLDIIDSIDAGIICFQEMAYPSQGIIEKINNRLKKYPYRFIFSEKESAKGKRDNILSIYSKHKIINTGSIEYEKSYNGTIYADIVYRGDTVRVINNHLQTSSVTSADIQFLSGDEKHIEVNDKSLFRLFSIIDKLSNNNRIRASQADKVHKLIEKTKYENIIVCGDHNDTPLSYTYNRVRGDLKDAFVEKGKWYGYTFKAFNQLLRIDYVFYSEKFEPISYVSPDIMWSDHKPVIVELKYVKKQ